MKSNPIERNGEDGNSIEELIEVLMAEPDSQCRKSLDVDPKTAVMERRKAMSEANGNANRLAALRKREAALKAAIAAEQVRQQKRKDKENARLFSVLGEALAHYAAKSPDFKLMLKQVLQSAGLRDTDRTFLAGKGWC